MLRDEQSKQPLYRITFLGTQLYPASSGTREHVKYKILAEKPCNIEASMIERRYSEFRKLHIHFRSRFEQRLVPFPSRVPITLFSREDIAAKRWIVLQQYMSAVIASSKLSASDELARFLGFDSNTHDCTHLLSDDLWLLIFAKLDPMFVVSHISRVSRRFRILINNHCGIIDHSLWPFRLPRLTHFRWLRIWHLGVFQIRQLRIPFGRALYDFDSSSNLLVLAPLEPLSPKEGASPIYPLLQLFELSGLRQCSLDEDSNHLECRVTELGPIVRDSKIILPIGPASAVTNTLCPHLLWWEVGTPLAELATAATAEGTSKHRLLVRLRKTLQIEGHSTPIDHLEFSLPRYIVAGFRHGEVYIIDFETGDVLQRLACQFPEMVLEQVLVTEGWVIRLYVRRNYKQLVANNVETGEEKFSIRAERDEAIQCSPSAGVLSLRSPTTLRCVSLVTGRTLVTQSGRFLAHEMSGRYILVLVEKKRGPRVYLLELRAVTLQASSQPSPSCELHTVVFANLPPQSTWCTMPTLWLCPSLKVFAVGLNHQVKVFSMARLSRGERQARILANIRCAKDIVQCRADEGRIITYGLHRCGDSQLTIISFTDNREQVQLDGDVDIFC